MKIVVFGATSAIAQAACREMIRPGNQFFLVGRDEAKLAAVTGDLSTRGATAIGSLAADLADTAAHPELLARIEAQFGIPDVMLLAHGNLPEAAGREATLAAIAINGVSPVSLAEAMQERMVAGGRPGLIVAISSVAGDRGKGSNYTYAAAKGLLSRYLEGLRHRLAREGKPIAVVDVRPGFTDTPMTTAFKKGPLWASSQQVGGGIARLAGRWKDGRRVPGTVYLPGFWRWIMLIIRHIPERIFLKLDL